MIKLSEKLKVTMEERKADEKNQIESLKAEITAELEPKIEERIRKELEEQYSKSNDIDREALEKEIRAKVEEEIREEVKYEIINTQENKNIPTSSLLSNSLKAEINKRFSVFDSIEDEELRGFLKEKSAQIVVKGMDYIINAGKIGQEVFELLGKKGSPKGVYGKWLEFVGIAESTMKRYRNRWEIYSNVSEEVKPLILFLTVIQIDKIVKDETIRDVLYTTEKMTYEELIYLVEGDKTNKRLGEKIEEVSFPESFDMNKFNEMFNNADKLDEVKKVKFYKLLEQLAKLLEEK